MVTHLANHRQNHQSYHRQNQHQNRHPKNHDFDGDFLMIIFLDIAKSSSKSSSGKSWFGWWFLGWWFWWWFFGWWFFDDDFFDDHQNFGWSSKNHHQNHHQNHDFGYLMMSISQIWIRWSVDFGDGVTLLHRRLLSFVIKIFTWNRYFSESSTHVQFF